MRRFDLVPDCGSCAALCCVAHSFERSESFAVDKAAGSACQHLARDARCTIHGELVERGFAGCAVYDCYGAGQRATHAFAGMTGAERSRNETFLLLRDLHELLWLLTEAAKLCPVSQGDLHREISAKIEMFDAMVQNPVEELFAIDSASHRDGARAVLRRVGDALGGRRRWGRALAVVA